MTGINPAVVDSDLHDKSDGRETDLLLDQEGVYFKETSQETYADTLEVY